MAGIIHKFAMGNPPFPEKNSLIFSKRKTWPAQHLQACQLVVSLL